jgi:hypothetical protein
MIRVVNSSRRIISASTNSLSSSNKLRLLQCFSGIRWNSGTADGQKNITVTFLEPDGVTRKEVQARVGESLLQHRHHIDLEGACEGGKSPVLFVRAEGCAGALHLKYIDLEASHGYSFFHVQYVLAVPAT